MPTIEGTRVKCPECGATTHASGDVIKCEYCGTESRVQRRTQVFQLPVKMAPALANHPQRIATQVRTRVWPVLFLIAVPVLGPFVLMAGLSVHQRHTFLWNGEHPLVVDVNGDGIDDAVGWARYTAGDRMKLRAISGKNGDTIWETDSVGTYIASYQSVLAISGTTIVRGATDKQPALEAYDLKTGKKLWSAVPGEAIEQLCASAAGTIGMVTKDKQMATVELATGKIGPAAATSCTPLVSDRERLPFFSSEEPHHRVEIAGMSVSHVHGPTAPFVATGHKSPGTPIPMVAAFDDNEHVLWKSEAAGHDVMQAKETKFAVGDRLVAALYDWEKDTQDPTVTVFDRATGKRLWEANTKYTGHMFVSLGGVTIGTGVIFTVVENSLQGFDPKTGERRFVVGSTD